MNTPVPKTLEETLAQKILALGDVEIQRRVGILEREIEVAPEKQQWLAEFTRGLNDRVICGLLRACYHDPSVEDFARLKLYAFYVLAGREQV